MNWKDEVAGLVAAGIEANLALLRGDDTDKEPTPQWVSARAYDLADALASESCRRYGHDLGPEGRFAYCDRCGESRQKCVLPPEDPT